MMDMEIKKTVWIVICSTCLLGACDPPTSTNGEEQEADKKEKVIDLTAVKNRLDYFLDYPVDSTAFPRSMEPDGTVRGVPSKDWTSGFYVGSLLYAYQLFDNEALKKHALNWLPYLAKEKLNGSTHDMGFKVYCSYGNAYKLTADEDYRKVIIESAETLATRFNEHVGAIKSWDFGKDRWDFPVIIDNMMNLELLYEASKLSGNERYAAIATSHANVTLMNHFRPNHSSYHVIDYDPQSGEVQNKLTHQGHDVESVWSRGQAWGLYGFTMVYRYTNDLAHLQQAEENADFIFQQTMLPEDMIPYWDMLAPNLANQPRDASAAAVTASALIELSQYSENGDQYRQYANAILKSLTNEPYVLNDEVEVPFILAHSTGNMPKNDEIDLPISYADYYLLEALVRLNDLD